VTASSTIGEFESYWRGWRKQVDEELGRLIGAGEPEALYSSMRYSIEAGGKRLRPLLVLATVEALGHDALRALPAACAVELVHTFSLIHDDLPSLDNDDFRRGVPSNHVVHGEATAILAGDTIHALAFQVLARDLLPAYPAWICLQVIRELAEAAVTGLAAGQMADLMASADRVTTKELREIHANKTGSMFRCAVRIGGILGGATPAKMADLDRYATSLGLAFQIADDILDVTGTLEQLGKSPGKDERDGKATYVNLHGLAGARERLLDAISEAERALSSWQGRATRLRQLAQYVGRRAKAND